MFGLKLNPGKTVYCIFEGQVVKGVIKNVMENRGPSGKSVGYHVIPTDNKMKFSTLVFNKKDVFTSEHRAKKALSK